MISADITLSEPAPEDIEFTAVDWYWLIENELVCNDTVTMTTPTDRDLVSLNATLYYYRCLVSSSTAVVKVRGQATLTQYQVYISIYNIGLCMYIVQLLLRSVVYSNSMEELNPYKEINISVSKYPMYLLCHTMYLLCCTMYLLHYTMYLLCHTIYLLCHTMYLFCHTMYLLHYTMYLLHYIQY